MALTATHLPEHAGNAKPITIALGKVTAQTRAFLQSQGVDGASEGVARRSPSTADDRPAPAPQRPQRKPKKAQPIKRSSYQLAQEKRGRELERDRKRAERLKAAVDASGRKYRTQLEPIPERVWRDSWANEADHSGRTGWELLNQHHDKAAIGAIRSAAFADLSEVDRRRRNGVRPESELRRDWSNPRSRHIVTIGLAMLAMMRDSNRYGVWQFTLENVPQGAFALLCRDPVTGKMPSISAVGHHEHRPGGNLENGQCSYIEALHLSGLLYRLQRRKCEDDPSCSQYFLIGFTAHATPEQLHELHELILTDSVLLDLVRPRPPPGFF